MKNSNTSRSLLFVILALLCALSAHAVDGKRSMSQYLRQRWDVSQGMPGTVNSMAQTADGYLWLGTDSGLYRFDGRTFRAMRPDSADIGMIDHVRALVADPDGSLWIWMQSTSLLRYTHGHFERAGGASWDGMRITAMSRASGANGAGILLSTLSRGIVHMTDRRLEQLGQFRGTLAISVAQTTDGRVWLGTRDRGLTILANGKFQSVPGTLPDLKMNCLLPGPNGQLWIGTDNGLALWNGTALNQAPFPAPLDHAQVLSLVLDRDGNLWAGTSAGLVRYSNGHAEVLPSLLGDQQPVTTILEDREGNLWFGGPRGIERLRDSTFAAYTAQTPGPGAVFVDSAERVWFAPRSGGLLWFRDGETHTITADHLADDVVYSISGFGNDLWLGRQRGGVTHLTLTGDAVRAQTIPLATPQYEYVTYSVRAAHDGTVWLGTLTGGVFHLNGSKLTQYTERDGVAPGSVTALEEGPDGAIYVGTSNGLSRFLNGRWQSFTRYGTATLGDVTTLYVDLSGTLWVGTGLGLGTLTATGVEPAGRDRALFHERFRGLAQDRTGWLWAATPLHIFKVRRDALLHNTLTDADIRLFDDADGLRGIGGSKRDRAAVSDSLGRIWISTNGGLALANPANEARSAPAAIAHVEQVLVDGAPISSTDTTASAAAQKRIAFNFTGLSFRTPEHVRYRYRLDGFDRNWSEPTAETQAIYTNLSPGDYLFRVMASGSDGQWSPLEATQPIRILPRFWQTWWFRAALVLFTLFTIALLYQLRLRAAVRRSNRMLEERLTERTRIAQELHDTLLQGFFSASMQLRVIADSVQPAATQRPQLERILVLMGKVLDDGRNAVQGLRSSAEDAVSLHQALAAIAQTFADEENVAYTVTADGTARELRPGVQAEIARIVQEALGNASHHAQSTRVEVLIRYQPQALQVTVQDDGIGIPADVLAHGREGHWGLPGMRERATAIGGTLEITSAQGTTIALNVPANAAYRRYTRNPVLNWLIEVYRARPTAPRR